MPEYLLDLELELNLNNKVKKEPEKNTAKESQEIFHQRQKSEKMETLDYIETKTIIRVKQLKEKQEVGTFICNIYMTQG